MEEIDPQRFVLPALLALLFVGAFAIIVTNGSSNEPAGAADPPARSQSAPKRQTSTQAANASAAAPTATAGKHFVKVKAGDTPTSIAEAAGLTPERLLELNPSVDPGSLRPGQTLKLSP